MYFLLLFRAKYKEHESLLYQDPFPLIKGTSNQLRVVGRRGVTVIASEQKKRDVDRILTVLKEQISGIRIGYKLQINRSFIINNI